jgi:BirA family biotin operon repressor/biotin-[acetyl-CoA-carboxylase] ligase
VDLLDARSIRAPGAEVRVVGRCGSTNEMLLREPIPRPVLLAADVQTAGRGRRGRRWHSPPGCGALFSLGMPLARPVRELSGLSIVVGVATVRALRALGAVGIALKWPNDLLLAGAKLGGILVETRSQGGGSAVVAGIGLNHRRAPGLSARLRRGVAALEDCLAPLPARTVVIGAVGRAVLEALREFDVAGLAPFRGDWERLDAFAGRPLRVRLADGRVLAGVASGLDADGALRLRTRGGLHSVRNGRVLLARHP